MKRWKINNATDNLHTVDDLASMVEMERETTPQTETFNRRRIDMQWLMIVLRLIPSISKLMKIAEKLFDSLKGQLTEVKKITLLKESATIEECNDLEKYTVIVTSDEVLSTTLSFNFNVIPFIIHYNMPATRQVLLARLSKARRGFNSSHIQKYGQMQLRTEFVIPLGQMELEHEHFISRE